MRSRALRRSFAPLLFVCFVALGLAQAEENERSLGVGFPYLPVQFADPQPADPVARIVLTNLCPPLLLPSKAGARLNLIESLALSGKGQTLELAIAKHVGFNGRRPLTAHSLRASFRYLLQHTETASHSYPLLETLSRATPAPKRSSYSESPGTLVVPASGRNAELTALLTVLPVVDAEVAEHFGGYYGLGTNVACAGHYFMEHAENGRELRLKSSGASARPAGPYSSGLVMRAFDSGPAALAALRVGGVEIIALPTPELMRTVAEDPTLAVIDSPLAHMSPDGLSGAEWQLKKRFWSRDGDETDGLITDKIIVRRSLKLTQRALDAFDLSDSYLP